MDPNERIERLQKCEENDAYKVYSFQVQSRIDEPEYENFHPPHGVMYDMDGSVAQGITWGPSVEKVEHFCDRLSGF